MSGRPRDRKDRRAECEEAHAVWKERAEEARAARKRKDKAPERRHLRRLVASALGVSLVTVGVLLGWWSFTRRGDLLEAFRAARIELILLAVVMHVAAHAAWAVRFAAVACGVGSRFRFLASFRIVTAGNFAAAITPARVGGEGLRLWLLTQEPGLPGHPPRLVAADRTLDVVFFLVAGLVAIALLPALFGIDEGAVLFFAWAGVGVMAAALVAILFLVVRPTMLDPLIRTVQRALGRVSRKTGPRVGRILERTRDEIREGLLALLREHPGWLLVAGVMTLVTWTLEFSILWVVLRAFGHDVPLAAAVFGGALLTIVSMVPVSPGGSGVVEVGAQVLFAGIVTGLTPLFVLAWRATTYYYDIIVGGLLTLRYVTPEQLDRIITREKEGKDDEGPGDP